jgi:hypothetical protein
VPREERPPASITSRGSGEIVSAGGVFSFDCFLSSMERQKNNWQNRFASAFSLEVKDAANRPCPLF